MAATKGKAAKKADAPATEPVENKEDKEAKTPEEEPEAEETSNEGKYWFILFFCLFSLRENVIRISLVDSSSQ